jgi:hypothetical protein
MPFMIKTNKICVFKPTKKNKDNYVNIGITSTDYLIWFETLYKWCIKTAYDRNEDWFNDEVTMTDLEFSFINPLKSNIKDKCFDIQCVTNQNRLHIVDTKDNSHSLDSLTECNIIPTFHIKGINFNSTYFTLEIEVTNMLIILEDNDENNIDSPGNININHILTSNTISHKESNEMKQSNNKTEYKIENKPENKPDKPDNKPDNKPDKSADRVNQVIEDIELDEVIIPTNDLEEMNMDIESSGFYKIYELLDEKIKDSIIQNLQKIFNKKKIKLNVDLMDIFDEE